MRHAFVDVDDKTMCSRCGNEVSRVDEECPSISNAPTPAQEAMTVERIAEIERRLNAATPGPYRVIRNGDDETLTRYEWSIWDEPGNLFILNMERRNQAPSREWVEQRDKDFDMLAHAPTDLRDLLAFARAAIEKGMK